MRRKIKIGDKVVYIQKIEREGYVMGIEEIGTEIRLCDTDERLWVSRREIRHSKTKGKSEKK